MLPSHGFQLLLANCRPTAAAGLALACESLPDLVVCATCHKVADLPAAIGSGGQIQAIVIDAEMFDDDASRALAAVRVLDPDAYVLLLTTRIDEPLLDAIAHDHVSCVSAYSDAGAIVAAVRALLTGQTILPSEVQRALADTRRRPAHLSPVLTSREEQVLELAATGLTIAEIAGRLHISHSTAKTHLLRVYEKLNAPNRSAAVATALARGMLRLSTEPA